MNMNINIKIGDKLLGQGKPCFIIAEAGVNHNGSFKIAKKLVDAAKDSGADAVKFQTFRTEELVTKDAKQAKYQKNNARAGSQFEMLKKLELSENEFREIAKHCKKRKIIFLSTPFDFASARFLNSLGIPAFKIGSGELTNIAFLKYIAGFKKPVVLSTGMSTLEEVDEAVKSIYSTGNRKLILLHCTSNYPAEFRNVNLKTMITLSRRFKVLTGYSDHTKGIEVALASAALGAVILEKHFTLSKGMKGPDHKASLNPAELKKMIEGIKGVELFLGNGIKKPVAAEIAISKVIRKSVVALTDIEKGTKLKKGMLGIKRPGTGIEPKYFDRLTGKVTLKFIRKDSVLKWSMIKK